MEWISVDERLTVDNPRNNRETLLNYAYAKDGGVYLSYADGECGVDLCEYIAKNACCEEVDAKAIMDGACMECDNKTALLYIVAVQAAELRARLAHYEDLAEQGRLVILPCNERAELERDGEVFEADHWNHTLTAFRDDPTARSGRQVGLFSIDEAAASIVAAKQSKEAHDG